MNKMNTYEVVLTKSYIVKIQALDKDSAKEFSQIFTGDIQNISTNSDETELNFKIEEIECKSNEVYEINELYENN